MKEKDIMTENCNGRCENGFEKFEEGEEEDDDDVIIQLIVQGNSVNVGEQLLTRYSKYFWNLLQNLPPLPQKNPSKPLNGKNSKIMGFLKRPCYSKIFSYLLMISHFIFFRLSMKIKK